MTKKKTARSVVAEDGLDKAQIAKALAKQLAAARRGNIDASELAGSIIEVSANGAPLRSNVCTLGICIDFEVDRGELGELLQTIADQRPRHIEVFPFGIVMPDGWRVSVTYGGLGE